MADSLDTLLSDKPLERPEVKETTTTEKPEDYKSRKEKLQEKEWKERGLEKDPDTGSYREGKPEKKEEKVEAKPEAKTEPKVEAKAEEKARDPETGKFVKQEEKPAAPQQSEKEVAFQKAMMEERRKRQELENRLKSLESAKPAEAPKSFWDDPEAALKRTQEEVQRVAMNTRLATAEAIARSRYNDFDDKIAVFSELVQSTPGLQAQCLAAPDPAEFAYKTAKNHLEIKEFGSIDAYKEDLRVKMEAKIRAEIEASLKAKQEELEKARAALTPSLTDARSTGVNKPVWSGPTPLDGILNG